MKNTNPYFTSIVEQSTLLAPAQKRELLDSPELLPEEYRMRVIELLTGYEQRSKNRLQNMAPFLDLIRKNQ